MAAIRSKGMKPELKVRKLVHALGYRYRLHRKDLPGKPDLVFGPRKKLIFVNGCFWHQHSLATCIDSKRPKSNTKYWNEKLDRNVARDKANLRALKMAGWRVLTIWECELKYETALRKQIVDFLEG